MISKNSTKNDEFDSFGILMTELFLRSHIHEAYLRIQILLRSQVGLKQILDHFTIIFKISFIYFFLYFLRCNLLKSIFRNDRLILKILIDFHE